MAKTIFLPGAVGSATFWMPVAKRVAHFGPQKMLAWPGLGNEPASPDINGIDDLVKLVLAEMDGPANLVAQSMGGVVAIKAALAAPERVRRMVLVATSGGLHMDALRQSDWRAEYRRTFPAAAAWITEQTEDLSSFIPRISAPVLLIWGDDDPISPVAVGERLLSLLPNARLEVIPGGTHDLAREHATEVARLIEAHIR